MMKPPHVLEQYHLYKPCTQEQPVSHEHTGNYIAFTVAEILPAQQCIFDSEL